MILNLKCILDGRMSTNYSKQKFPLFCLMVFLGNARSAPVLLPYDSIYKPFSTAASCQLQPLGRLQRLADSSPSHLLLLMGAPPSNLPISIFMFHILQHDSFS